MCGAIAGALKGIEGIKKDWLDKMNKYSRVDQKELALKLTQAVLTKD